jgi:hypothetical protein
MNFCFGFEVTNVYPGVEEINITYMLPRDAASNTYEPLYDLTTGMYNSFYWNTTFTYGTPQFMLFVTDMVVTMLTGKRVGEIQMAFFPMKTPEFMQLEPFAEKWLALLFPFFYMCIFLLPLYYMVTKLAEEKESKAREGMKMMGLNDKSYFTAWWIFMLLMIFVMSSMLTISSSYVIFKNSNLYLVFLISMLYGMTLYGVSFSIAAFLPSKKSSATFSSLIHIVTFYLAFSFGGPYYSESTKLALSLIPNCALVFAIQHLFHCELEGSGLSLEMAAQPY